MKYSKNVRTNALKLTSITQQSRKLVEVSSVAALNLLTFSVAFEMFY